MMTTLPARTRAACLTLALAAIAAPAWAQASRAPVSDDRVRELLALVRQQQGTPAPQATASTAPAGRPLTIDEAVSLALERNLDIQVERQNPRTFELSVQALKASYLPNLTSTIGQNDTTALPPVS